MVYFWRRQQRSVQTSVIPSSLPSPTHHLHQQQLQPPPVVAALSPLSRATGQARQLHILHTGITSRGSISVGHNIITSGGTGYFHHSKGHQISAGYMLDKLSEYSRRKLESDRRKVAERELDNLNMKIDKLLLKMEDTETQSHCRLRVEDECVVCLAAAATMQTFPCGHKVVCRKCLIKTIQVAVSQRCLPLRCVICRDRILTLHHTTQFQGPSCGATVLQASTLPATLIPPVPFSSRSVPSPVSPTSPTGLFSFITSPRYQGNSPRLLSPAGASVQGIYSLTSNTLDKLPKPPHIPQSSSDDEFLRYAPTDIEAFVNSHNDALNLHKAVKPNENKASHKQNRQNNSVTSGDAVSHSFVHCQSVKIHPTATELLPSFMDTSGPDGGDLSTFGSKNLQQKPVGASKFLAKFLPRKSKRKCSWFRQEN